MILDKFVYHAIAFSDNLAENGDDLLMERSSQQTVTPCRDFAAKKKIHAHCPYMMLKLRTRLAIQSDVRVLECNDRVALKPQYYVSLSSDERVN